MALPALPGLVGGQGSGAPAGRHTVPRVARAREKRLSQVAGATCKRIVDDKARQQLQSRRHPLTRLMPGGPPSNGRSRPRNWCPPITSSRGHGVSAPPLRLQAGVCYQAGCLQPEQRACGRHWRHQLPLPGLAAGHPPPPRPPRHRAGAQESWEQSPSPEEGWEERAERRRSPLYPRCVHPRPAHCGFTTPTPPLHPCSFTRRLSTPSLSRRWRPSWPPTRSRERGPRPPPLPARAPCSGSAAR